MNAPLFSMTPQEVENFVWEILCNSARTGVQSMDEGWFMNNITARMPKPYDKEVWQALEKFRDKGYIIADSGFRSYSVRILPAGVEAMAPVDISAVA
jgi:hypothetical protein